MDTEERFVNPKYKAPSSQNYNPYSERVSRGSRPGSAQSHKRRNWYQQYGGYNDYGPGFSNRGFTSQEFADAFLPDTWGERHLQSHIKSCLEKEGILVEAETQIHTPNTNRYSDLETWNTRYEVKKYLTYENLKSAAFQLRLYDKFGQKIGPRLWGWGIPKRKIIIGLGLNPYDEGYTSSQSLIRDLEDMGYTIVEVNKDPRFWVSSQQVSFNHLFKGFAAKIARKILRNTFFICRAIFRKITQR